MIYFIVHKIKTWILNNLRLISVKLEGAIASAIDQHFVITSFHGRIANKACDGKKLQ